MKEYKILEIEAWKGNRKSNCGKTCIKLAVCSQVKIANLLSVFYISLMMYATIFKKEKWEGAFFFI